MAHGTDRLARGRRSHDQPSLRHGNAALLAATQEIESGLATAALVMTCDRTSNGPHIYYPNAKAPGGTGAAEDWVLDNCSYDELIEELAMRGCGLFEGCAAGDTAMAAVLRIWDR